MCFTSVSCKPTVSLLASSTASQHQRPVLPLCDTPYQLNWCQLYSVANTTATQLSSVTNTATMSSGLANLTLAISGCWTKMSCVVASVIHCWTSMTKRFPSYWMNPSLVLTFNSLLRRSKHSVIVVMCQQV